MYCSSAVIKYISIHAPTKGATKIPNYNYAYITISIHAPTKGATANNADTFSLAEISIHAPTKGATLQTVTGRTMTGNFNPRSHEGSDAFHGRFYLCKAYFNPRSHEGSDSNFIQFYILYFSISINLYQYFPSYFLSLPSPYNFCTFILVRVLLYYRVYLPFAQQSYNKNIIC